MVSSVEVEVQKKAKHLVVDTNAFIKGIHLEKIGTEFWTVQEVLDEVRDKRARKFISTFPFDLKIREPTAEAYKAVSIFAKKTGDYGFLSAVDLKVLALTYTFENEINGIEHLRTQPVTTPSDQAPPEVNTISGWGPTKKPSEATSDGKSDSPVEPPVADLQNLAITSTTTHSGAADSKEATPDADDDDDDDSDADRAEAEDGEDGEDDEEEDDDDDDGWITPDNYATTRATHMQEEAVEEEVSVGCITSDYSMQNVLLQMGMKLVSVDGYVMKRVRQLVLKCHSCFKICKDTERKFCPACGNATMLRFIAHSQDDGTVTYQQAQRIIMKGSIYSMPLPKGGKHNSDLILTEDTYMKRVQYQKDPKQRHQEEYSFASNKSGPRRKVVVGHGSRNPNVPKKRIGKKNTPVSV